MDAFIGNSVFSAYWSQSDKSMAIDLSMFKFYTGSTSGTSLLTLLFNLLSDGALASGYIGDQQFHFQIRRDRFSFEIDSVSGTVSKIDMMKELSTVHVEHTDPSPINFSGSTHPFRRSGPFFAENSHCPIFIDVDKRFYDQWSGPGSIASRLSRVMVLVVSIMQGANTIFQNSANFGEAFGLQIRGIRIYPDDLFGFTESQSLSPVL